MVGIEQWFSPTLPHGRLSDYPTLHVCLDHLPHRVSLICVDNQKKRIGEEYEP